MRCELVSDDPPELMTTDSFGSVLRVGLPGWDQIDSREGDDDEWGDLIRVGRARGVHLPPVALMMATDGTIRDTVTVGMEPYSIEAPTTIHVDAAVRGRITISEGAVRVEPTEHRDAFRVRLDGSVRVRVAFQSRVPSETIEITVPSDIAGVARALSTAHRSITERSPDRTWPSVRPRTATVTAGDEVVVPSSRAAPADPAVVVFAPPDPAAVLPLAPVAAYLGAVVRIERGAVRIVTDEATWRITPPADRTGAESQRAYERAVHGHLERAFWLDCLAREAGDVADEHTRSAFLGDHGLSAERLYDASIPERLAAYDRVPVASVRETFPDWHYAISVRPEITSVETLGHRLHNLPLVHVADGEELSEVEVVARSLEASRRGAAAPGPRMVEPQPTPARTHAWAGDRVPLGGWKLLDGDGTRSATRSGNESLEIVVVLNDTSMHDEEVGATEQYGRRSDELGIDVRTETMMTPVDLAHVLESDADLVHFIGHHDTGKGLRCYGGHLTAEQLAETDVRTFFINACGSYRFAQMMIRKGAEGGVATTTAVTDEVATGLSLTWSRLMTYGWPVTTALEYARSVSDKPVSHYVAIGDGTTTLTQSDAIGPPVTEISKAGSDQWRVEMVHQNLGYHGGQTTDPLNNQWWLSGSEVTREIDTGELRDFLERLDNPVIVDEDLYWPTEHDWIE